MHIMRISHKALSIRLLTYAPVNALYCSALGAMDEAVKRYREAMQLSCEPTSAELQAGICSSVAADALSASIKAFRQACTSNFDAAAGIFSQQLQMLYFALLHHCVRDCQ